MSNEQCSFWVPMALLKIKRLNCNGTKFEGHIMSAASTDAKADTRKGLHTQKPAVFVYIMQVKTTLNPTDFPRTNIFG